MFSVGTIVDVAQFSVRALISDAVDEHIGDNVYDVQFYDDDSDCEFAAGAELTTVRVNLAKEAEEEAYLDDNAYDTLSIMSDDIDDNAIDDCVDAFTHVAFAKALAKEAADAGVKFADDVGGLQGPFHAACTLPKSTSVSRSRRRIIGAVVRRGPLPAYEKPVAAEEGAAPKSATWREPLCATPLKEVVPPLRKASQKTLFTEHNAGLGARLRSASAMSAMALDLGDKEARNSTSAAVLPWPSWRAAPPPDLKMRKSASLGALRVAKSKLETAPFLPAIVAKQGHKAAYTWSLPMDDPSSTWRVPSLAVAF